MSNYDNGSNNNNKLDTSSEMKTLASINVHQIADWTSGEVITEQKFEETFSLIGSVINNHFNYIGDIIAENKGVMKPTRFLGRVDTLLKLPEYIIELNKNSDFSSKPAPASGDTIQINTVEINELPQYLEKDAGSYLFIYVEEKKGEGFWKLFVRVFDPTRDIVSNALLSEKTDKVLDPTDLIYKAMIEWDPNVFNAYTRPQVNELLNKIFTSSGIAFQIDFNYPKDFLVFQIVEIAGILSADYYISLVENNIGHLPSPKVSNEFWGYLPNKDIPIGEIVEILKPYISTEITKQLDNAPFITVYDDAQVDNLLKDKASLSADNIFTGRTNLNGPVNIDGRFYSNTFANFGGQTQLGGTIIAIDPILCNALPTTNGTIADPTSDYEFTPKRYVDRKVKESINGFITTEVKFTDRIGKCHITNPDDIVFIKVLGVNLSYVWVGNDIIETIEWDNLTGTFKTATQVEVRIKRLSKIVVREVEEIIEREVEEIIEREINEK